MSPGYGAIQIYYYYYYIVRVRGHFALLLFCRVQLWNVQRFTEYTCTAFLLLIKPFVWWCSLTSWFAPDSVHTTSEEFKNPYSFISTVRRTDQSNPSRKGSFSALQTGGIWKRRLWVFLWTENILKRTFSNTMGSGRTTWFPWPRLPQTKI